MSSIDVTTLGRCLYDGRGTPTVSGTGATATAVTDRSLMRAGPNAMRVSSTSVSTTINASFTLNSGDGNRAMLANDHPQVILLLVNNVEGGDTSLRAKNLEFLRMRNAADTTARTTGVTGALLSGSLIGGNLRQGFNNVLVGKRGFGTVASYEASAGAGNWNNATNFGEVAQLRFGPQAGIATDIVVDGIYLNPNSGRKAFIEIDIDDVGKGVEEYGFEILAKYNLPFNLWVASVFTSAGSTGPTKYMSWDELLKWQESFGENCYIGNHSFRHESAAQREAYSLQQAVDDLMLCEADLLRYGIWTKDTERHHVSPQGSYSANLTRAARMNGYITYRTTLDGVSLWDIGLPENKMDSQYHMRCSGVPGGSSFSDPLNQVVVPIVEMAIAVGGHHRLLFHTISPNGTGTSTKDGFIESLCVQVERFDAICKYLARLRDAGFIEVGTRPQFVKRAGLVAGPRAV